LNTSHISKLVRNIVAELEFGYDIRTIFTTIYYQG
jgi:hypothetical protein